MSDFQSHTRNTTPTLPAVPDGRASKSPRRVGKNKPTEKIYTGTEEVANACTDFRANVLRLSQDEMAAVLGVNRKFISDFECGSARLPLLTCYYYLGNKYQRTIFLQKLGEALEQAGKPTSMQVREYNAKKNAGKLI